MCKRKCTVVHIDSDENDLSLCIDLYKIYSINVAAFNIIEYKQPDYIFNILNEFNPKILVITGHDSIKKNATSLSNINSYSCSKYFMKSVKIARYFNPNPSQLVIFSGGCESFYEGIMKCGANFASSPTRTLLDITAPANIACKIATTPKNILITTPMLYREFNFIYGSIGGIPTLGQLT